jgi:triphosphoribosyl-dephospho-CoA synthase
MSVLRQIGIAAEAAMLQATDGINTHRGVIFGMGLLCAAAGTRDTMHGQEELGTIVRRRWGDEIGSPTTRDTTHGAVVWRRYGVGGARREAIAGFPHLYEVAWPALRLGRRLAGGDEAAARAQCLFALMAALEDTNLLHRGGVEGLLFARALAVQFIELGGVAASDWRERALGMHHLMVARHLSPGGSADLLAMTLFVDSVHAARTNSASQIVQQASLV